MKAHSIDWSHLEPYENSLDLKAAQRLAGVLTIGGRVFRAVVPAMAIIMAAAWLIAQPALLLYLQVSVWSAGFVFLALALDSLPARTAALHLISGLAMFALAAFSGNGASELLVVGAAVVAVWTGFSLFDHK